MTDRVWASEDGTSWYLLPEDAPWPEGDHFVRDLLGRTRRIDRGAAEPHRIDKARADEHSRKEILYWLSTLGAGVDSLGQHLDTRKPGTGQSLGALRQVLDLVALRLAKPGEVPPKVTAPDDLMDRIEGFVRSLSDDPAKIEGLKRAAADIESAAERFRALTPGRRKE